MPSRTHTSSASHVQSRSQNTSQPRRPKDISGFFPCAPLPSLPSLSHPICARVSRPFAPNLFPSCTAGCSSTPARNGAFSLHAAQIETTRRIPTPASPDHPCSNQRSVTPILRSRMPPAPSPSWSRTLAARTAALHAADPPFAEPHSLAIRLAVAPEKILPLAGSGPSHLSRSPAPAHFQNRSSETIRSCLPNAARASTASNLLRHTRTRDPTTRGLPCLPSSARYTPPKSST